MKHLTVLVLLLTLTAAACSSTPSFPDKARAKPPDVFDNKQGNG